MQTISEVSKKLNISSRMLRYYEEVGLIKSQRMDGYAYRVYDEANINRLRQIIILRKLRIPVKQIRKIFDNRDAISVIEIFERNINELDEQITALSTVKSILHRLVQELNVKVNLNLQLDYLSEIEVFDIVESITFPENKLQEVTTLEDLSKADEALGKLEDKDVRIVYVPPMTVAVAHVVDENMEGEPAGMIASDQIGYFVYETELLKIKPDARGLGFDCSAGGMKPGVRPTAYEAWVSIPDEMEVPAPLTKKTFEGGLYAAHVLRDWSWQDWKHLMDWVDNSDKYERDNGPYFEEMLNYYNLVNAGDNMEDLQFDLLLPIKERAK